MDFGALPPEINSARMYSGPGSGPMMAAAAAWNQVAAELHSAATSYGTAITRLSSEEWQGPASASMAQAAAPYVAWMNTSGAQAEQAASQARVAAAAYEHAYAMTVPPSAVAANRAQLMHLVQTDVMGENIPAIQAAEAQYGEMWAQDAAAMYGYAGHSAVATQMKPFTPPPQTTNPAGSAAQGAAVAHATGSAAASKTLATTPQALQMLAAPASSTASQSGTSSSGLSSIFNNPALKEFHSGYANWIHSVNAGMRGICAVWRGTSSAQKQFDFMSKAAGGAAKAAESVAPPAAIPNLGGVGGGGLSVALGQANSVGGKLSVPPVWAPPAPVAEAIGPVSGGTWQTVGPTGLLGEAPLSAAPGAPGMPGVAGPAGLSGMGARAGASGLPPRYGLKPIVMPRPPFAG
ncbi:PPE family protein [Mycobacterium sp. pUA109]|uniref:PPE family protein n=1 Tax=Mycobacterium sp. pUA109 TaxID=3238982 RepID=UPI00351B9A72